MNYLEFFNLGDDPFRMTPDSAYFYPSREHNEILDSLQYAIDQKEGFSVVVGEPGTGKTTILRILVDHWKDRADIALIMTPRLAPEEFLQAVLEDIHADLKALNKNEMLKAFRDILLEHAQIGKRVIIIVDEAQDLPDETLEELRLLSNLETEKEKLLQIMLIGQPELKKRLQADHLRQLNQRVSVRATLKPLTKEETRDYLHFRLIKAGKGGSMLTFEESARNAIYTYSKGIPRLINLVSSRAVMAAFVAGSNTVKKVHVQSAVRHLRDEPEHNRTAAYALYGLCAGVLICAGVFGFFKVMGNSAKTSPATGAASRQTASASEIQKKTVMVIVESANLRESPSLGAQKVGTAGKGASFGVFNEKHDESTGRTWFGVRGTNGREYWVSERVVKTVP